MLAWGLSFLSVLSFLPFGLQSRKKEPIRVFRGLVFWHRHPGGKTPKKHRFWTRMTGMTRMTSPWLAPPPPKKKKKNNELVITAITPRPRRHLGINIYFLFRAGLGPVIFVIPDIWTPEPQKRTHSGFSRSFFHGIVIGAARNPSKIPFWTRMTGMTRMTSPWRVAKMEPFRVVRGLSVWHPHLGCKTSKKPCF